MGELQSPLSNAQLELLKLFSSNLSDAELDELKKRLLEFKFQRVTDLADKVWDEEGWSDEHVKKLLKTHLRTPYNRSEKNSK